MPRVFGGGPKCTICTKSVYKVEEMITEIGLIHRTCSICNSCKKPIPAGSSIAHDNALFCGLCHKKYFGKKGLGSEKFKIVPGVGVAALANNNKDAVVRVEIQRKQSSQDSQHINSMGPGLPGQSGMNGQNGQNGINGQNGQNVQNGQPIAQPIPGEQVPPGSNVQNMPLGTDQLINEVSNLQINPGNNENMQILQQIPENLPFYGPHLPFPVHGPHLQPLPVYGPNLPQLPFYGPRLPPLPFYGPHLPTLPVFGPHLPPTAVLSDPNQQFLQNPDFTNSILQNPDFRNSIPQNPNTQNPNLQNPTSPNPNLVQNSNDPNVQPTSPVLPVSPIKIKSPPIPPKNKTKSKKSKKRRSPSPSSSSTSSSSLPTDTIASSIPPPVPKRLPTKSYEQKQAKRQILSSSEISTPEESLSPELLPKKSKKSKKSKNDLNSKPDSKKSLTKPAAKLPKKPSKPSVPEYPSIPSPDISEPEIPMRKRVDDAQIIREKIAKAKAKRLRRVLAELAAEEKRQSKVDRAQRKLERKQRKKDKEIADREMRRLERERRDMRAKEQLMLKMEKKRLEEAKWAKLDKSERLFKGWEEDDLMIRWKVDNEKKYDNDKFGYETKKVVPETGRPVFKVIGGGVKEVSRKQPMETSSSESSSEESSSSEELNRHVKNSQIKAPVRIESKPEIIKYVLPKKVIPVKIESKLDPKNSEPRKPETKKLETKKTNPPSSSSSESSESSSESSSSVSLKTEAAKPLKIPSIEKTVASCSEETDSSEYSYEEIIEEIEVGTDESLGSDIIIIEDDRELHKHRQNQALKHQMLNQSQIKEGYQNGYQVQNAQSGHNGHHHQNGHQNGPQNGGHSGHSNGHPNGAQNGHYDSQQHQNGQSNSNGQQNTQHSQNQPQISHQIQPGWHAQATQPGQNVQQMPQNRQNLPNSPQKPQHYSQGEQLIRKTSNNSQTSKPSSSSSPKKSSGPFAYSPEHSPKPVKRPAFLEKLEQENRKLEQEKLARKASNDSHPGSGIMKTRPSVSSVDILLGLSGHQVQGSHHASNHQTVASRKGSGTSQPAFPEDVKLPDSVSELSLVCDSEEGWDYGFHGGDFRFVEFWDVHSDHSSIQSLIRSSLDACIHTVI